jgi:hypothetical protein
LLVKPVFFNLFNPKQTVQLCSKLQRLKNY